MLSLDVRHGNRLALSLKYSLDITDMTSRGAINHSVPVLVEDLFDGWLAMPYMEDLFEQTSTIKDSHEAGHPHVSTPDVVSLARTVSQGVQNNPSYAYRRCSPICTYAHQDSPIMSEVNTIGSDRAVRQRRGHTKSRLGCIACKKRKVKVRRPIPLCKTPAESE